jgi:hypothetical protein
VEGSLDPKPIRRSDPLPRGGSSPVGLPVDPKGLDLSKLPKGEVIALPPSSEAVLQQLENEDVAPVKTKAYRCKQVLKGIVLGAGIASLVTLCASNPVGWGLIILAIVSAVLTAISMRSTGIELANIYKSEGKEEFLRSAAYMAGGAALGAVGGTIAGVLATTLVQTIDLFAHGIRVYIITQGRILESMIDGFVLEGLRSAEELISRLHEAIESIHPEINFNIETPQAPQRPPGNPSTPEIPGGGGGNVPPVTPPTVPPGDVVPPVSY